MMYEHLPKNTKTFRLDIVGDDTMVHYKGDFTVKCILNLSGRHAIELEKTRLMADLANPSSELAGLATVIAVLRAKIIDAPTWWKNLDDITNLIDENVVVTLYEKCIEAEVEWREKVRKAAEEAREKEAKESPKEEENQGN